MSGGIRQKITRHLKKILGINLGGFYSHKEYPFDRITIKKNNNSSGMVSLSRKGGESAPKRLKFSIVTPSLNQGRFIEETVKSIVNQEYPIFEYIIQDALSIDETKDVLEKLNDKRIDVFFERDNGQSDAINRGFSRSSGDIMCYINSDDLLLPDALQYVASTFEKRKDVDVVYADRLIIDEEGKIIGDWRLPPHDSSVLRVVDYIPQETLFWRRTIWDKIDGMDTSLHFAMDWDLILRFESVGARFLHIPKFLGAFRVHHQQKTQKKFELGKSEVAQVRNRYTGKLQRALFQISHFRYLMQHRKINKNQIFTNTND